MESGERAKAFMSIERCGNWYSGIWNLEWTKHSKMAKEDRLQASIPRCLQSAWDDQICLTHTLCFGRLSYLSMIRATPLTISSVFPSQCWYSRCARSFFFFIFVMEEEIGRTMLNGSRQDVAFPTLDGLTLREWLYPAARLGAAIIMTPGVRVPCNVTSQEAEHRLVRPA